MVNIPLPPIMTVPTRAIAGFDLWSPVEAMIRCETMGPVVVVVVAATVHVVVVVVVVVLIAAAAAAAAVAMCPPPPTQTLVWSSTFSSTDTVDCSRYNGRPTSVD